MEKDQPRIERKLPVPVAVTSDGVGEKVVSNNAVVIQVNGVPTKVTKGFAYRVDL